MAKIKKRGIKVAKYTRSSRKPFSVKVPKLNDRVPPIMLGAAAGCLIGAAAAFFLTPQKARHGFTQSLDDLYDQVSDTAEDYLDKGHHAYEYARDTMGNICSSAANAFSENGNRNRNLMLGIIGAGLLGASAVYAYVQGTHKHLSFADKWKLNKWSEMANLVFDTVSDKLQSQHKGTHPINQVLDWASVGLNLWQEIKKRG